MAAAALPDKAARAINDVRLKLYSASDGISSELSSISYLLSFLETESPRGHQEAPRHKLQRELALIAWGINPAKWRQLVSECMNEANVQCIDPQEQPGRFDQQLGVDWIKKHLSSY